MEHENIIKKFIESLTIVLTKVVEKHPNPPSTYKMEGTNTLKNAVQYTDQEQDLDKTDKVQSSAITTDGDVSSDPGAVPPGIILEKNYTVKELANGNQEIKQEDPIETELK
jgi:hypothetical protein